MLVFVIPLKSKQISRSWELTEKLFERTIKSVCNQTSSKFRVIVTCHEIPSVKFSHPFIEYFQVNYPLNLNLQNQELKKLKESDKVRKVITGLAYAQNYQPSHIMIVDADDCVSKHLAKFVEKNPNKNGWFLNKGYLYTEGSNFLFKKRNNFNHWCGTSNIFRANLYYFPKDLNLACSKSCLKYYHPHQQLAQIFSNNKTPIEPLPFSGAIYSVCHGDNLSDFTNVMHPKNFLPFAKQVVLNYRPLTQVIRREFGLSDISLL